MLFDGVLGQYAFPFFAFCVFVFVFVVATGFDGGVEDLEEDDFFRGCEGACFACFGEDTPALAPFVRTYRVIPQ
jgi:hypothetical protein